MPACIVRLLEDTTVLKVGLSLHDDFSMLHQRAKFKIGRFIDLQNIVSEFGIEDLSLQKLYANLFHKRITKRQQLSNWEAPILTEQQKYMLPQMRGRAFNFTNDYKNFIKHTITKP